jgi:hypothetical protein
VRIYSGSVLHLINGSRILKNTSLEDGGGIAVYQGTVNLINALIGENTAGNNGGGFMLEEGRLVMVNSLITDNKAFWNGGGLAASSNSSLTVKTQFPLSGSEVPNGLQASPCVIPLLPSDHYCTEFRDNRAGNHGGGLHLDHSGAAISHTAFIGNVASRGAAFVLRAGSLSLSQALIRDQVATDTPNPDVGWVYTEEAGETAALEAVHTTWAGNTGTAVRYEGNAGGLFNNNIVWGNSARGSITPAASAGCNNTQDGALDGPDNLCLDPRFATTSRGGYRLLLGSPSLDACSTGNTPDLDGRIRPRDAAYDMGAFEGGTAFLYLPLIFGN